MTINDSVFRAILAMDSYNRGYLPGIVLSGNQLGTATLRTDIGLPTGSQAASFFAQAYTWNGHTVISYRGNGIAGDTDFAAGTGVTLRWGEGHVSFGARPAANDTAPLITARAG